MAYRIPVIHSLKVARKNIIGIVIVSIAFSIALFPFVSSIALGSFGWLGGLWTSSLLSGIVLFGAMTYVTKITTRDARVSTTYFVDGIIKYWRYGIAFGVLTFAVLIVGSYLIQASLDSVTETSVRIFGVYIFIQYYILAGFTLSIYTLDKKSMGESVSEAIQIVVFHPSYMIWYVFQVVGWSILAVLTLVSVGILLPGYLALLSATFVIYLQSDN